MTNKAFRIILSLRSRNKVRDRADNFTINLIYLYSSWRRLFTLWLYLKSSLVLPIKEPICKLTRSLKVFMKIDEKLNENDFLWSDFSSSAIFGHFPAAKTKFEVRLTKIKWNSVWSIFGLKATTQIVKTERQQRWRQTRDSLFKEKHINKKALRDWFYLFSFVLLLHSLKSFSDVGGRKRMDGRRTLKVFGPISESACLEIKLIYRSN